MQQMITVQIPFDGFYESVADEIFRSYEEHLTELNDNVDLGLNYSEMRSNYVRGLVNEVLGLYYNTATTADTEKLYSNLELVSPREYNFETDRILVDMPAMLVYNFLEKQIKEYEYSIREFWENASTQRSGYIPNFTYQQYADLDLSTIKFTFCKLMELWLESERWDEYDVMTDWAICNGGFEQ